MKVHLQLKLASLLYHHAYLFYKPIYFRFKNKKDRNNLELIKSFVKPGSNILDIGSNIGFYSSFLSEIAGANGHVWCFEPDKKNFLHLENTLRGKSNVTLIQKAAAADSGKLKLFTSPLLNVDHRSYPSENAGENYEVEKISIDDYVDGKFNIDFIKIDIQGFESEAFRGMKKTLSENPSTILSIEFWPYGLQQAGSSAAELYDLISENGFQVYRIGEKNLTLFSREDAMSMKVEYYTDCNVLLTRNSL